MSLQVELLRQRIWEVAVVALHVNRKLAPVIFQMSHVGPESIILPLLCFCTLSHTIIQLLQSPFNPKDSI